MGKAFKTFIYCAIIMLLNCTTITAAKAAMAEHSNSKLVYSLELKQENSNCIYTEDIQIKLILKDQKGNPIKFSKDGCLYLTSEDKEHPFSKQYLATDSDYIAEKNRIIISSTCFSKSNMKISGYYEDKVLGMKSSTAYFTIQFQPTHVKSVAIKKLVQDENFVKAVEVETIPATKNLKVQYQTGEWYKIQWVDEIPQKAGLYPVYIHILGDDCVYESEASATLLVRNKYDNYETLVLNDNGTKKVNTYRSSDSTDNYLQVDAKNDLLKVQGKYKQSDSVHVTAMQFNFNSQCVEAVLNDQNEYSIEFDTSDLKKGMYQLNVRPIAKETELYDMDHVTVVSKEGKIYLLQNQTYELNKAEKEKLTYVKDIDTDDRQYADVKAQALAITKDCKNDYERAQRIYEWVCENIYYNMSEFNQPVLMTQDISNVFITKRAVCEGYTNLLRAMLESVGVQTNVVHGYCDQVIWGVSDPLQPYSLHTWVEAYSSEEKRWISMDPTLGSLNQYHGNEYDKKGFTYLWFDVSLSRLSKTHFYKLEDIDQAKELMGFDPISDSCVLQIGTTVNLLNRNYFLESCKTTLSSPEKVKEASVFTPAYTAVKEGSCDIDLTVCIDGYTFNKVVRVTVKK